MQRITGGPLESLVESWQLSMRARNLSSSTQHTYLQSALQLVTFLADRGVTAPEDVEKIHVEEFIATLAETRSAGTASVRFRALQQWFAWMVDEEETPENPMARMRPPVVPEQPPPVLDVGQVQALLAACEGKAFADRRDAAIVALLLDTGVRLAEITDVELADLDMRRQEMTVLGKGRRARTVRFGDFTARAVDRYLRIRARHRRAYLNALWLAERGGAMTSSGVAQAVKRRGEHAGIPRLHAHQLRHTSVHEWLADGGAEGDAMQLFGWKSRQMAESSGHGDVCCAMRSVSSSTGFRHFNVSRGLPFNSAATLSSSA